MTREEAILCFKGIKQYGRDTFTRQSQGDWEESLDMAIKALKQEKADETTDHPEWIDYEDGLWKYAKCPVCESVRNTKTPFCPICGTKMKGVIGK